MVNIEENLSFVLKKRDKMEDVVIRYLEKPKIKEPVFIEGLPGVGNVGKLAAEHLVDELHAKKFAEIYSKYFPPQVLVGNGGLIKLVNNELYYSKAKNKEQNDLIILVGDYQGLSPEGQYELSDAILKVLHDYNVKRIFTLGGYSLGKVVAEPKVLGAATNKALVKEIKKSGVKFLEGALGDSILGASGLFLGLGKFYDIDSVCLMGETSGYFVDPKSARAVLHVLTKILNLKINFEELEVKAQQIDQITSKLKEAEKVKPKREDLGYIG
jgi:uncharacterized protein (TIGR00162 family)